MASPFGTSFLSFYSSEANTVTTDTRVDYPCISMEYSGVCTSRDSLAALSNSMYQVHYVESLKMLRFRAGKYSPQIRGFIRPSDLNYDGLDAGSIRMAGNVLGSYTSFSKKVLSLLLYGRDP